MTGLEIALFILGAAFVIISFFIVDNREKEKSDKVVAEVDSQQVKQILDAFVDDTNKEADIILHDTEEKLEAMSNDKIMAVGEFSDQILEKIDSNHQEVVFLYQMLKDKEEELKKTASELDNVRIECEKLIREREQEKKEEENATTKVTALSMLAEGKKPSQLRKSDKDNEAVKTKTKSSVSKTAVKKTVKKENEKVSALPPESLDTGMVSKNDEIIALYKQKKSVMEISKLLGMGQGEVRLIIELYCK